MSEQFDLHRFLAAQDEGGTYRQALGELHAGCKRSHWMWFVFPQLAGLGHSAMARTYAISGVGEARAYLRHPVLGPRLRECLQALIALDSSDPVAVFGQVDAVKLRSSLTLFAVADPDEDSCRAVLGKYYDGKPDPMTLQMLGEVTFS
jgi:uncharacterized protein (DUF1810 family)